MIVDIFLLSLTHVFTKMKYWNLDIIDYWVIGTDFLIEKDLELSPSPPNCSTNSWKLLPWKSLSRSQVWWQVFVQKIYSKFHPVLCAHNYREVTDLGNHGMVKIVKTWRPWGMNINFLWNKNILKLCLRWHILRSCCFEDR